MTIVPFEVLWYYCLLLLLLLSIISLFLTDLGGFTGDVYLLVKLLLPGAGKKRVYNLQSKQIVKILSQVCHMTYCHMTDFFFLFVDNSDI